jgi:hypothetical protein
MDNAILFVGLRGKLAWERGKFRGNLNLLAASNWHAASHFLAQLPELNIKPRSVSPPPL